MDTFTPPLNPDAPLNQQFSPRMIQNNFGDGYAETSPDGLNAYPAQITPRWSLLTLPQKQSLDAFFKAHIGVAFFYTLPDETVARKWLCTSFKPTQNATWWSYDATFNERFDLT
jgi:phage-related protein